MVVLVPKLRFSALFQVVDPENKAGKDSGRVSQPRKEQASSSVCGQHLSCVQRLQRRSEYSDISQWWGSESGCKEKVEHPSLLPQKSCRAPAVAGQTEPCLHTWQLAKG